MQVQRTSNFQTSYNNSNTAFGINIIKGKNLQAAINASPVRQAIENGLAGLETLCKGKEGTYEFEMPFSTGLSMTTGKKEILTGINDPKLTKPGELLGIIKRIIGNDIPNIWTSATTFRKSNLKALG